MLDEWDPRRGRQGRAWRTLVKELCPPGSSCEIPDCDKPSRVIVFGLRRNHPLGPSLDHILDLQYGGHPTDPANLRPAHFGCNAGKRTKVQAQARRPSRAWPTVDTAPTNAPRKASRQWPSVDLT